MMGREFMMDGISRDMLVGAVMADIVILEEAHDQIVHTIQNTSDEGNFWSLLVYYTMVIETYNA